MNTSTIVALSDAKIKKVTSTAIEKMAYPEANRVLILWFNNSKKKPYMYYDINLLTYGLITTAKSIGRFVVTNIVNSDVVQHSTLEQIQGNNYIELIDEKGRVYHLPPEFVVPLRPSWANGLYSIC